MKVNVLYWEAVAIKDWQKEIVWTFTIAIVEILLTLKVDVDVIWKLN